MQSKVTPRKVGVGLKWRRSRVGGGWAACRLAWWGSTEKKEASHLLGLRGRHQYSDQRSNRNRAPCVVSTAVGTEGEEDQMARSSAKRKQLTEEGREARRSLMKIEKSTGPRTNPCGTPRWTRKQRLVILKNYTSVPVRKERLSPTNKTRKEASRNEFMEKSGMPDRVKSF